MLGKSRETFHYASDHKLMNLFEVTVTYCIRVYVDTAAADSTRSLKKLVAPYFAKLSEEPPSPPHLSQSLQIDTLLRTDNCYFG